MKLVMTKHRKDGTIEKSDAITFHPNRFSRIRAPHLSNENICELKRHKRIEIDLGDDGKLVYSMIEAKENI